MKSNTYIYISSETSLRSEETLTTPESQESFLKTDRDYTYVFSENHSGKQLSSSSSSPSVANSRSAFSLMLGQLKSGDTIVMWSWRSFVIPDRLNWAALDVQEMVRDIRQHEASVIFVNEHIDTSTASGRQCLLNTLASAQYAYDVQVEKAQKKASTSSSSSCCTKTSPSC